MTTSDCGVCPGLECSGTIEAVGRNVKCWKVGERVCAILDRGGYAEQVAVPADFLLPLPDDIDLADAAGLPYASCGLCSALFKMRDNKTLKDKKILIREGTSGIGALAIQYAKYMGLKVIASTGSSNKFSTCRHYGADFCVDHTSKNFVQAVIEETEYAGVDFVLDYGASDLQNNIECCGSRVFDLQSRDLGYKASAIAELRTQLWPAILQQKVFPAVEHRFPMIEARKALNPLMERVMLND